VAMPPASTPQRGIAAANRLGYSWTRPAVMIPPSDTPHAITRFGFPTCLVNIVEQRDLVLERVLERPAARAVCRPSGRVAVVLQPVAGLNGWCSLRLAYAAWRDVAVAVKEQGAVPVGGHVDSICRRADVPVEAVRIGLLLAHRGLRAGGRDHERQQKSDSCCQMLDRPWAPSTAMEAPFSRLACFEHTNATTPATSSTVPKRPSGISWRTNSAMPSGSACCRRCQPPPSHKIDPGATPLTVTPLAATSRARDLTRLISAALAALYAGAPPDSRP